MATNWQTFLSFCIYLLFMVTIGIVFSRRSSSSMPDYILGGRRLGSWVTAFSAEASDMSGWLLLAVPGTVYFYGINQTWIVIGLFLGTVANWILVAKRLRNYTGTLGALTMNGFLDQRVKCPGHIISLVAGLITLGFFLVYSASGLVGAGKLFEAMFGIPYKWAVLSGTGIVMTYILLGGFLAVCWTDFFQGTLMFFALIIVPVYTLTKMNTGAIGTEYEAAQIGMSILPVIKDVFAPEQRQPLQLVAILSTMAWGLGYFGQPHILVRFMGIKSSKEVPKAIWIACIWVAISMMAAVVIGMVARGYYGAKFVSEPEAEGIFIFLIRDLFHPLVGGVLLAAILAAIMSTIDSQLLVCSSAITNDIIQKLFPKRTSDKGLLWLSRFAVVAISLLACCLAFDENSSIFDLVTFAWGGFGAAFGPAVLMSLYSRKTSWQGILLGMIAGTGVALLWKLGLGFSAWMYEIVPGFIANFVVILICNLIWPQKNEEILKTFDQVIE